jgi:hypothetical protein
MKKIKQSASNIIAASSSNQKIALYRFNDEVMMLNTFTQDADSLLGNVNKIKRHGTKTMLYNSIYDSIELISKVDGNNKAVIIFTDGKDEGSSVTSAEVMQFAKEQNIPLYFMCLKNTKKRALLAKMSKSTGGKVVFGDNPESVTQMYNSLVSLIKNQYNIKYKSRLSKDGQKHKLEVRLNYKKLRDRAKGEFFLPGSFLYGFLNGYRMPTLTESLLIVLVFLVFIFLMLFILHIFRRGRGREERIVTQKESEPTERLVTEYVNLFDRRNYSEDEKSSVEHERTFNDPYSSGWLVKKEGTESGKKFPIHWEEYTIGREKDNSLVVEDDNAVSLKHAKIRKDPVGYMLFDLASDNGTFLNKKKLLRPKLLYDWDEIQIGRTCFIFRGSKVG